MLYPRCPDDATPVLDSVLITNTNGDEELIFDLNVPLTYIGNSLDPDVPSFGDHTSTAQLLATHKIFTSTPRSEYVELDGVVYTEDVATVPPTAICLPTEIGKIFNSAVNS